MRDEMSFYGAVVVDLLGVGLLVFRCAEPSILEKNSLVVKKRQMKLRDLCFGIGCTGWIQSNKAAASLHPTYSIPHTHTNTRTTTLGSHLRWARFGPEPCPQAAPVP